MTCRLAPDPSLTPTLSRRARERTRYANFIVRRSATTTSTGCRSFLPSPQPLSPLGRGALGQVVRVVLEPFLTPCPSSSPQARPSGPVGFPKSGRRGRESWRVKAPLPSVARFRRRAYPLRDALISGQWIPARELRSGSCRVGRAPLAWPCQGPGRTAGSTASGCTRRCPGPAARRQPADFMMQEHEP